ncbi:DUF2188 domain-containing protein [Jeotgalibaca caeni]|uniref:DUF2188 domain-containing protein n=1 Tax=Jeotgalibaca caeni TaxID=3028623 RepID=UPI00237D4684|nr:DUF2188 domain-containing protein [Jeotgalibaca caeni]MDE1547667.1 DUF2188 domain-containing protein [Jeotgalibaca caeni]
MPWTEKDYPASWKNFDETTRLKAIDIANAMLEEGYKEEDAIPIATAQAKKWVDDATDEEKKELEKKDVTEHEKRDRSKSPEYMEQNVHVQYDHDDKEWDIKTEGAKRASQTFDTKKDAEKRAKEIAKKRDTDVISHKKDESK